MLEGAPGRLSGTRSVDVQPENQLREGRFRLAKNFSIGERENEGIGRQIVRYVFCARLTWPQMRNDGDALVGF